MIGIQGDNHCPLFDNDKDVSNIYYRDEFTNKMKHYHKDNRFWSVYLGEDRKEYILRPFTTLRTIKDTPEEDWKTAIAQGILSIPKGEEVTFIKVLNNFYGSWLNVIHNGREYSIDSRFVEYVKGPEKEQLEWVREVE